MIYLEQFNHFSSLNNIDKITPNHCVGTNKLLGQDYSKIFFENDIQKNNTQFESFHELCILMRSFIVIDDFIKDENYTGIYYDELRNLILDIEKRCIHLIISLGETVRLWNKYKKIYETTNKKFQQNNLFESVSDKCSFLFLPFEMKIISNNGFSDDFKHFVKYFLFSLQLLDDFKDIEEDITHIKCHNLFLRNLNNGEKEWLLNNKQSLAIPLLLYIYKNIITLKDNLNKSKILIAYYNNSIQWFTNILKGNLTNNHINIFHDHFEDYCFSHKEIKKLINEKYNCSSIDYNMISAENMHSLNVSI